MAVFSFDEYVYEVMNIKAENDISRKKQVIRLTLDALDKLCPGSFMPFFFLYAASYNRVKLIINTGEQASASSLLIKSNEIREFILPKGKLMPLLGDVLVKEIADGKISQLGMLIWNVIKSIISVIGIDENENSCFWDFHEYTDDGENVYVDENEQPLEDSFYDRLKKVLGTLESHDPFFQNDFNKAIYYVLVCFLINSKLDLPNDMDYQFLTIDDVMRYYREQADWHNFYDEVIMDTYSQYHPEYKPIPRALTRIVNGLFLNAETHVMYDPICSLGMFALNVNAQMSNLRDQKSPRTFITEPQDEATICATAVRLLFRDCTANFDGINADASNVYFVAMPMMDLTFSDADKGFKVIKNTFKLGIDCVQKDGKMAIIIPSSVLVEKKYEEIRQSIIELPFETKIISLPKEAMGEANISVSIVYVDGTEKNDEIKLVDAFDYVYKEDDAGKTPSMFSFIKPIFERTDIGDVYINYTSISNLCYHDTFPEGEEGTNKGGFQFGNEIWNENCYETDDAATDEYGDRKDYDLSRDAFDHDICIIGKDDIKANGNSLNPSDYFNRPVVAPVGFEIDRLSEVLQLTVEEEKNPCIGKVLSRNALQEANTAYSIDIDTLPIEHIEAGTPVICKSPTVVMSKYGTLKTCFVHSSSPVYYDGKTIDAYTLRNDSIMVEYLVNEMHKDYFAEQVQVSKIRRGLLNNTKELSLFRLRVNVPLSKGEISSIETQKEIVRKELEIRLRLLSRQNKLLNDQRFNEYIMSLRQRKHRIAQILNQVCPAFNLLNRTREKNDGILRDTDIVATRTGENVAQYFGKVQLGLDKIERLVDTLVDKNQWGKQEVFSLEDFVSQFASKHICKNYQIALQLNNIVGIDSVKDETDMLTRRMVNMPKDELSTVFENIIANAETWGFNDSNRTDYAVRISLGESEDRDNVLVFIANNGTPIHPSVDREHIFDWGVGTHTGVGTWQAKNIVEHYGGNIRINEYPDAKDGFQTEYEISLPREY